MSGQISLKEAERKAFRTARRADAARGFHRECAEPRSELQLPLPRPDSDPIQQPGQRSHEVVYGVTSLLPQQADAARLLSLVRGHWRIEKRLHWVRDVTFDEDRSTARCGSTPQVMAALRNTTIALARLAGDTDIAAAYRH